MVKLVEKSEFEKFFENIEIRPFVAEQVTAYIKSRDFEGYNGTLVDKLEQLGSRIERKGYGARSTVGPRKAAETASFENMHKSWRRKNTKSGEFTPKGSQAFALAMLFYFFKDVGNPVVSQFEISFFL